MTGFTVKILKQRGNTTERLYHLESIIEGKKAYYFVRIDPLKEKQFLVALNTANIDIDLHDFAEEILARGYGEPSEELKQAMGIHTAF